MKKVINIYAPELPESVNKAFLTKWLVQEKDYVKKNTVLAEIETDKIILEVQSTHTGFIESIDVKINNIIKSREILGKIKIISKKKFVNVFKKNLNEDSFMYEKENLHELSPSKRRKKILNNQNKKIQKKSSLFFPDQINNLTKTVLKKGEKVKKDKEIKKVRMTNIRKIIAKRLLEAKKNMVMLTTFNEVNMHDIISLKKKYNDEFKEKYGVRLGFMSFYVKCITHAIKSFPKMNAFIDKENIFYHKNCDINIAISTKRGLITPVLKNTNKMSMGKIEKKIKEFSLKAEKNTLQLKELEEGNFTITNGGVFGSLMSTPIINPPQVSILGIHAIQNRPVVVEGVIKILPMVYLALSYDHRLIDGKEAICFLKKIKEILENFSLITIGL